MKTLFSMVVIVGLLVGASLGGRFVLMPEVAAISARLHHAMTAALDNRGLHE